MKREQPMTPHDATGALLLPAVHPRLETIHCCRAEDLLTALPTGSIDLIVTSPPYDNLRTYTGFSWDFEYIARQSYRVLKQGGVMVWVVGDATVDGSETLTSAEQKIYFRRGAGFNIHDTMIYYKNANVFNNHHPRYLDAFEYMFVLSKGTPTTWNPHLRKNEDVGKITGSNKRQRNGELRTFNNVRVPTPEYSVDYNVWRIHSGGGHNDKFSSEHPAAFPEKLAERHILTWSNPGDVVLDFFGGSGTTAKMARKHNRRWMYCDISATYCDIAKRRLDMPYTPDMFATLAPSA